MIGAIGGLSADAPFASAAARAHFLWGARTPQIAPKPRAKLLRVKRSDMRGRVTTVSSKFHNSASLEQTNLSQTRLSIRLRPGANYAARRRSTDAECAANQARECPRDRVLASGSRPSRPISGPSSESCACRPQHGLDSDHRYFPRGDRRKAPSATLTHAKPWARRGPDATSGAIKLPRYCQLEPGWRSPDALDRCTARSDLVVKVI